MIALATAALVGRYIGQNNPELATAIKEDLTKVKNTVLGRADKNKAAAKAKAANKGDRRQTAAQEVVKAPARSLNLTLPGPNNRNIQANLKVGELMQPTFEKLQSYIEEVDKQGDAATEQLAEHEAEIEALKEQIEVLAMGLQAADPSAARSGAAQMASDEMKAYNDKGLMKWAGLVSNVVELINVGDKTYYPWVGRFGVALRTGSKLLDMSPGQQAMASAVGDIMAAVSKVNLADIASAFRVDDDGSSTTSTTSTTSTAVLPSGA